MTSNPKNDWNIEDLKRIAEKYNIEYRQPGGSYVTFRTTRGVKLTVPARKPIKEFYVKQFIQMIEEESR